MLISQEKQLAPATRNGAARNENSERSYFRRTWLLVECVCVCTLEITRFIGSEDQTPAVTMNAVCSMKKKKNFSLKKVLKLCYSSFHFISFHNSKILQKPSACCWLITLKAHISKPISIKSQSLHPVI